MSLPARLLQGYGAFRENRLAVDRARYRALAETGQRPEIMLIACCDSRAAPETIFDAAPGEMFVVRNVANLVPPHDPDGAYHGTSAAIEFAVLALEVRHIVVMGHGRCGGIAAWLSGRENAGDYIGKWMSLVAPAAALLAEAPSDTTAHRRALEFASIRQTVANLATFPYVRERATAGTLSLHGAWFDISTGELFALDQVSRTFEPALTPPG